MSIIAELPFQAIDTWHSEDAERYEIVDGVKVEMKPVSAKSTGLAADLSFAISSYAISHGLGKSYPDMLFRLPLPIDRNRRPDVGYVPFARWEKDRPLPSTNAWDVLPDLVAEFVSPTDLAEEVRSKAMEYLRAGVRLVWVIYPRQQIVDVYESAKPVLPLTREDELDGGEVIAGFRLPLRDLFLGDPIA